MQAGGSAEADVAVVGAGLAGLAAALTLAAAGRDVVVLEASDGVGGRVRTDVVDGFRLDRGFQVLLTAYPAARRWFDLEALDLRPFAPGVVVHGAGVRPVRLADPFRAPVAAAASVLSPLVTPLDGWRLLRWRHRILGPSGPEVAARAQVTTAARLAEVGFSTRLVDGFFRPFLAGTFFDADLTTSSRVTELVFRCFFRGDVAVPAAGMGALGAQLADRLPAGTVRLGTAVRAVEAATDEVRLRTEAGTVRARHAIVAVDAPGLGGIDGLPAADPPAPARGTVGLQFAADASPTRGRADLHLGRPGTGPIATLATMSDVAPTYAPPGRHLVSVSTCGVPSEDDAALEAAVRSQARGWFGPAVDGWRLLDVRRIPYAQPRQDPGDLPALARSTRRGDRLWVCGDHRDTGSIQGALVSGRRTADEVLAA